MDILNVVESKDLVRKEKVDYHEKNLSQMNTFEHARILTEMTALFEDETELTEEQKEVFEKINLSAEKKVLAIGYIVKRIQEAQDLIEVEKTYHKEKIKSLDKRKSVLQNRINSKSSILNELMNKLGLKKIEGYDYVVMLKKEIRKVTFFRDDINYKKYPELATEELSVKWDKKAMKEWLKKNESDDFGLSPETLKLVVK